MDLYIRSQNKLILTKYETLELCQNPDGTWFFNSGLILGKYKTKERTLEILDEIQNILIDYKEMSRVVYQMPQD